jgi:excisionase family DNA binding protein
VNRLLTSAEVAEYLRVPVKTLDSWSYRGLGPRFSKIGRHRRYDERDLEEWVGRQKNGSPRR